MARRMIVAGFSPTRSAARSISAARSSSRSMLRFMVLRRLGLNDFQAANIPEFGSVQRRNAPTPMHGGGRDNQVVRANHLATFRESCPDACMDSRGRPIQRDDLWRGLRALR